MKTKILAVALLFVAGGLHAASDRFGNERYEVPRTSFTESADNNVVISSVSAPDFAGSFVLRSVIFSGLVSSTMTFYDDTEFNSGSVVRTKYIYVPGLGTTSDGKPVTVQADVFFSSGIVYKKEGTAPVQINWDYLSPGTWQGKKGDARK